MLTQGGEVYQIDNALKSKKFESLARGVVARPGVPVEWQGVLASLYRMFECPAYVGGGSALVEHGLAHYIKSLALPLKGARQSIYLYVSFRAYL